MMIPSEKRKNPVGQTPGLNMGEDDTMGCSSSCTVLYHARPIHSSIQNHTNGAMSDETNYH